jgi:hypothetical protein
VPADGIEVLDTADHARLETRAMAAAATGRLAIFVPASGAATRLCRDLLRARDSGALTDVVRALHANRESLAMWPLLAAAGASEGSWQALVDAMVGEGGLALHDLPKGLVLFHRDEEGLHTAFDGQVAESLALAGDADGRLRGRMSVAPAHLTAFEAAAADEHLSLSFGVQDPATDTVALGDDGEVFRTDDGAVLFRPGGHGALLDHLQVLADDADVGDVVLIKNIDNITRSSWRPRVLPWRRRLAGLLVETVDALHGHVRALRDGAAPEAAQAWARETFGVEAPAAGLADWLDRPVRVAGMVRNTGAPGGGPFWVDGPDGPWLQIVEGAQIDRGDPEQVVRLEASTHFNPVDLVVCLRNVDGRPHRLADWVDASAVITTTKSHQGRSLRAYEHPGLWNGGMGRWLTRFVEIPGETFQPVKTLADLLRPAHAG